MNIFTKNFTMQGLRLCILARACSRGFATSQQPFSKPFSRPAFPASVFLKIQQYNVPMRYSSSGEKGEHTGEPGKLHKHAAASSLARSNFHAESEASLNRQINTELSAHYLYLAMATYFDRADVALPGFAAYFYQKSAEEREHALLCTRYMSKRGGRVKLEDIKAPAKLEWKNGLEAMEEALELEKQVNDIIIDMHSVANKHGDPQMTTFIEDTFFDEQTEDIKAIANYVGTLRKVGTGLGEFEFDFEVLQKQGQVPKFTAGQEKKRLLSERAE